MRFSQGLGADDDTDSQRDELAREHLEAVQWFVAWEVGPMSRFASGASRARYAVGERSMEGRVVERGSEGGALAREEDQLGEEVVVAG